MFIKLLCILLSSSVVCDIASKFAKCQKMTHGVWYSFSKVSQISSLLAILGTNRCCQIAKLWLIKHQAWILLPKQIWRGIDYSIVRVKSDNPAFSCCYMCPVKQDDIIIIKHIVMLLKVGIMHFLWNGQKRWNLIVVTQSFSRKPFPFDKTVQCFDNAFLPDFEHWFLYCSRFFQAFPNKTICPLKALSLKI